MAGYDGKRIARVKRLMKEGLRQACLTMDEPLAAKRFSIVNPSPARIYGETQQPFVLNVTRKALPSEGMGEIVHAMTYERVEQLDDEAIRNLGLLRQAAVDLVRALRRDREVARHSPDDANPPWACHAHHVFAAMLELARSEAGIDPLRCTKVTGQHDPKTPFCPHPNVTEWANLARGRWRNAEIARTTLSAGRICTPRMCLDFGSGKMSRVSMTSMLYTDVGVIDVDLPDTVLAAIDVNQHVPLRSIVDLPGFEVLPNLMTRSVNHHQDTSGLNTLRPVLWDERTLMGSPPRDVDMGFLTIGRDLLELDCSVTWREQ